MTDQYWDQVTLLLHMDGANATTYFRDERHSLVSVVGNTKLSTAQSKFGGSSAFFDGSSGWLSIPHKAGLGLSSGDITIEAWIFPTLTKGVQIIAHKSGGSGAGLPNYLLYLNGSNLLCLESYNHGSSTNLTPISGAHIAVPLYQWTHIAVAKQGATLRTFVNGVIDASCTMAGTPTDPLAQQMRIGHDGTAGWVFSGYIDEFRVTNGVARYTGAFTPPAQAFQTPIYTDQYWANTVLSVPGHGGATDTITDKKGKALSVVGDTKHNVTVGKFYGSSIYFDGTGDYIDISHADMGAPVDAYGDFTLEAWAYLTGYASNPVLFNFIDSAASDAGVALTVASTGAARVTQKGSYTNQASSWPTGQWAHVAVVRSGNNLSLYRNGTLLFTDPWNATMTSLNKLRIGANSAGSGGFFSGYMSDIRLTKYARYAANFTVPSEPFPYAVPQSLTGIVKDPAGNPIARTVRSYRRDTGALVDSTESDAVTGAFALRADTTGEHYVLVLDAAKNALIFDHVIPVL